MFAIIVSNIAGTGTQMEKINKDSDLCDNSKTNLCKSYVFLMGELSLIPNALNPW